MMKIFEMNYQKYSKIGLPHASNDIVEIIKKHFSDEL